MHKKLKPFYRSEIALARVLAESERRPEYDGL